MNVCAEDGIQFRRLANKTDQPILPNVVVSRKGSPNVGSERLTDGREEVKKLMSHGPVPILQPFEQVIKDWLDRRIASAHCKTSRLDVGFVFWNQRMS